MTMMTIDDHVDDREVVNLYCHKDYLVIKAKEVKWSDVLTHLACGDVLSMDNSEYEINMMINYQGSAESSTKECSRMYMEILVRP